MSATQRRSRVDRIRQLYVDEGKSIDKLREIVNHEFNLVATRRHYVHQIQMLKIERNTKPKERQKVVQHIKYLRHATRIEESRIQVRVRGHKIDTPKWTRWLKNESKCQLALPQAPPSPLPSFISISTCSPCGSPKPTSSLSWEDYFPGDATATTTDGQVFALIQAIENGTASLGDRDEQGLPPLYYAASSANVEMCQFLIRNGADVNELVEVDGIISPVHSVAMPISIHGENALRHKMSRCLKVMLDAGADLSLKSQKGLFSYTIFYLGLLFYSLETFEHMVISEQQFICPREFAEVINGQKRYSLHLLAEHCGYGINLEAVDIVEKAILLLKHGADISKPNFDGCTVVHTILSCCRRYQYSLTRRGRDFRQRIQSRHEPKEFLIVAITAGANVYAIDDDGRTPSVYARIFNRELEWLEALRSTGYDPEEVVAHSDPDSHDCSRPHQISRLSFKEYCSQRVTDLEFRKSDISDGESGDSSENEDDNEEMIDDEDDGEEETDNENMDE